MKWMKLASVAMLLMVIASGTAFAQAGEIYRQQSDANKMLHKLGRGITNVLTCWVEVPRQVATEWEARDPISGLVLGTIKGVGWGFARFATGVYETFTFPLPIPEGYKPLIEPEFVVTDVWGDPIPGFYEAPSVQLDNPGSGPVFPGDFHY